jgi:hypothetical protein
MKDVIKWIHDAMSLKSFGMQFYCVDGGMIKATNTNLTAGYPWQDGSHQFLVPGAEFEKLLDRLPGDVDILVNQDSITIKSGRFRGTVQTLPMTDWNFPGVDAEWKPVPAGLVDALRALRPFISDNTGQQWAMSVALQKGWCYATNNITLGGTPCPELGDVQALLQVWAVDFVTDRADGLCKWAWTDHYVAFGWENGAWMRAQLIVGSFPERAADMVRSALNEAPSQAVTDDFRAAFDKIAALAEDTVIIYADRIESTFGKARVVAEAACEVPADAEASIWGAKYLIPALQSATHWSPAMWPKPAVFRGPVVSGWVVGRRQ